MRGPTVTDVTDHNDEAEIGKLGGDGADGVHGRGVGEHHHRLAVAELVNEEVTAVGDVDGDGDDAGGGRSEPYVDQLDATLQEQRGCFTWPDPHSEDRRRR